MASHLALTFFISEPRGATEVWCSQFYLQPDIYTSTHPALTSAGEGWQPFGRLLDLPTPEGWKAELT